VDDGSTDDTLQVVRNWQSTHSNFALQVVSQPNRGQGAARNHGARLANAPILLFTDADCVPVPGWAAAFLETFRRPDAPDAAMGAYVSHQTWRAPRFAQLEFEERYARMARQGSIDLIATYSAAYKRDLFLAAGGFDERLAQNEDVELSYRLSAAGRRLVFTPEAQVAHEHDLSWVDYAITKMGRGYWRTLVYRRHMGKAGRDSYTPQLLKVQLLLAPLALWALLATLITRSPRRLGSTLPFLLTTLPMMRFGVQRRATVTPWVPLGSLVRALAFGVGIARALLGGQAALPQPGARQTLDPATHAEGSREAL
jgi:GT2 family glycosyltransferase